MQRRQTRVMDLAERRRLAHDRRLALRQEQEAAILDADPLTATITVGVAYLNNGEPFDLALLSEVTENLWIGGAMPGAILPERFRHVVSCHPWTPYFVAHDIGSMTAYPIIDGDLPDLAMLEAMASLVNACRHDGETLVHCSVGLNRSALVAGLALIRGDRMCPGNAVDLLRERRNPNVLCNRVFAEFLEEQ